MALPIRSIAAAVVVAAAGSLGVSSAQAQQATAPDTADRLPPVVTIAKPKSEGLLSRAWNMDERRREVILLEQENRMLAHRIRQQDKHIARLEVRLGALKARERNMIDEIATIDSATEATRAQRRALEARLASPIARRPDR